MIDGVRARRVADDDDVAFTALVAAVEPPLRRAFVAAYGADAGRETLADVLAWAWEHLDRVRGLDNPAGYLVDGPRRGDLAEVTVDVLGLHDHGCAPERGTT